MYKYLIRPILFLFPPETIHYIISFWVRGAFRIPGVRHLIRAIYRIDHPSLSRNVFGIDFPNPVGLAAGFDKNADLTDGLGLFGFGFIEIGTVTPLAQPGNPRPRLFRLKQDKALVNRMGFNNDGIRTVKENLCKRKSTVIVGGNIGKNKRTENRDAIQDYLACFEALYDSVDYFVVNVSSPNTPGLRELQDKEPLENILKAIKNAMSGRRVQKPLLLKIAPDLGEKQLDDIIDLANELHLDGLVATNTTIGRGGLQTPPSLIDRIGAGGLSGMPLRKRSTEIIRYLKSKLNRDVFIIGTGGVMNAEDAIEKLDAGADLIQIYTGFIYEGPGIVRRINESLTSRYRT